jgi:uncharacterized damage-inducible protein DinB
MNRDALNELFDFTNFTWETYARALKKLPPETLTRKIDGSGWGSVKKPLLHIAAAWDGWLAEKAGDTFSEFPIDEIVTWDAIQELRTQTRGWIRRILDETSDAYFYEKLEPTHDGPGASLVSASTVMLHILLHERGHHGDITTTLSQAGAAIGNSDYLIYLFFKNRQ